MIHVWRIQMLRLFLLVFMLGGLSAATAQEAVTEIDQAQYELERKIQAGIEQLRQLHTEGRFEEVVANANYLLSLDSHNTAAKVWKDRAQERLQKSGSTFPAPGTGRTDIAPTPIPEATPEPPIIPEMDFTPVPLAPRQRKSGISDKLNIPPWMLAALAVVAIIFLAIAVFAWLRVRSSQKQLSEAISEAEKKRAAKHDDVSFSDRPTSVHDAVTQVQGGRAAGYDDDSVMQFGGVGVSDETGDDYLNSFKPGARQAQASQAGMADEPTVAGAAAEDIGDEDTFVSSAEPQGVERDEVTSLDLSDDIFAAPPAPASAVEDPNELSFNSMMFANEETLLPPAAPPPAKKPVEAKDEDALSFNSLMFSGAAETKTPGQAGPADTSVQSEDPDAMTFNSLMFSGADETRLPGAPREETAVPGSAPDEGEMTFNSMMFGGNEETLMPPGMGGAPQGGAGIDQETTQLMTGMQEGEETINISGLSMEGDSVGNKFDQEKSLGLSALSRGDFKAAVQALSVAAGLRPDDREVAAKLAEARKRRDG